jgi:hypothetical protein
VPDGRRVDWGREKVYRVIKQIDGVGCEVGICAPGHVSKVTKKPPFSLSRSQAGRCDSPSSGLRWVIQIHVRVVVVVVIADS